MQNRADTTTQATSRRRLGDASPTPGVVLIFANGRPRCRVFRWEGVPLELGRLELCEDDAPDPKISRKHVRLAFDGEGWRIADLSSRNGTFSAGAPFRGEVRLPHERVVRLGGALLLTVADALPFHRYGLGVQHGVVGGPRLRKALDDVALARRADLLTTLLIAGESGTGKELAARAFHAAGPKPEAPLVAVNCATIPKDIAERLLFGSRRGAFSGAIDATGHVQAANGGTLFLDEIGELALEVQTKLLRMLESREVFRLGASSPEQVDVQVCAATWRDLKKEVVAGRFREDLYFRIGQPEIRLPALRERVEEIPWHVQSCLEASGGPAIPVSSAFIEACALRPWPGNVRELRAEVRRAAALFAADGRALGAEELSPDAGRPLVAEEGSRQFPADEVSVALLAEQGNVLGAARKLGIHRNKVRRWLERNGLDARHFRPRGPRA